MIVKIADCDNDILQCYYSGEIPGLVVARIVDEAESSDLECTCTVMVGPGQEVNAGCKQFKGLMPRYSLNMMSSVLSDSLTPVDGTRSIEYHQSVL